MLYTSVKKIRWLIALLALVFTVHAPAFGQDTLSFSPGDECPQKDLPDVIRGALHKPPKVKSESAGCS